MTHVTMYQNDPNPVCDFQLKEIQTFAIHYRRSEFFVSCEFDRGKTFRQHKAGKGCDHDEKQVTNDLLAQDSPG